MIAPSHAKFNWTWLFQIFFLYSTGIESKQTLNMEKRVFSKSQPLFTTTGPMRLMSLVFYEMSHFQVTIVSIKTTKSSVFSDL